MSQVQPQHGRSTDPAPIARPAGSTSPQASIVIPTLNESENIDPLLERVLSVLRQDGLSAEVVIADGGSTDGTQQKVRRWSEDHPVRLLESDARRGLAGDILAGADAARSDTIVVMDADLSHPPEALPAIIRPVLEGTHDLVLGSRYIPGGATPGWPKVRRWASKFVTMLARPLVSVRDPMSGFFAVRRAALQELGSEATGFKIAMEVLARGDDALRVKEVPITFVDRERGQSKLGFDETWTCLKQFAVLGGGAVSPGHAARFAITGLLGLALDLAVFRLLDIRGMGLIPAHLISFAVATIFNYVLNARWTFADTARLEDVVPWRRYFRFLAVALMGLFLRGAVVAFLTGDLQWGPQATVLAAVAVAAVVNFIGTAFFVFPQAVARTTPTIRWRVFALCIVAYVVLLRVAFSGVIELIPEEAYYWSYAKHPDLGYLDHPPMVGWLIGLSTWLLGEHEFAVRLPALVCWGTMAYFMFRLAKRQFGKTAAYVTVLLLASLPVYFGVGLLTTPDSPLYASWAGSLYFLEAALVGGNPAAWPLAGLFLGLGMLSKYTIALLGLATLAYIAIDRDSRRWFVRPEPYTAVAVALVVFSGVILWNIRHDFASFTFQGSRRWSGAAVFSLHEVIAAALVLLTPIGVVGIIGGFRADRTRALAPAEPTEAHRRRRLFTLAFVLAPLSIFVLHSLRSEPKPNWTGPLWLAAIPLLAATMLPRRDGTPRSRWMPGSEIWWPTIVVLLLIYGGGLYYLLMGLPGLTPKLGEVLPAAWRDSIAAIDRVDDRVFAETGRRPLVAGMDKYYTSSENAFYDADGLGVIESSGRHLVGDESLMWSWWQPASTAVGRDVVLVSFRSKDLQRPRVAEAFDRISDIQTESVVKNGKPMGLIHYRVGYGYRGVPASTRTDPLPPVATDAAP